MSQNKLLFFFLLVIIGFCISVFFYGLFPVATPSEKSPDANPTLAALSSAPTPLPYQNTQSNSTPTIPVLNPVSLPLDSSGCPVALTHPKEEFACPRALPPFPETYHIADPAHPSQKDLDAIPVNFPGVDRTRLVEIALNDPCIIGSLISGADIEGIVDQPRPSTGKETVRWPPTLITYRRINCTEMLVFFDINPEAGNISRIQIDYK
ncbi:MAG: hypothetical protein GYA23_01415 [Methanomicrobiales archaeon]|nr:hypothetical protein [Methanomicrobiales archaeon]